MNRTMFYLSISIATIILIVAILYFTNNGYSKSFELPKTSESITDNEGNIYNVIKIGNQVWMAENLRTQTYNDGSKIKESYYYNDDNSNADLNGLLYSGNVISNSKSFCPKGWRIPTDEDYKILETYLGMENSELDKMGWRQSNSVATKLKVNDEGFFSLKKESNSSKFGALPAGVRTPDGKYTGLNMYSDHWTSTEIDGKLMNRSMVWFTLHPGKNKIYKKPISKDWGFSIRLIKE